MLIFSTSNSLLRRRLQCLQIKAPQAAPTLPLCKDYGPYLLVADPHTFPPSSLPCRANILVIVPTTWYSSIAVETSYDPKQDNQQHRTLLNQLGFILFNRYRHTHTHYTTFVKNILIIFKANLNMMTYITYKLWVEFSPSVCCFRGE